MTPRLRTTSSRSLLAVPVLVIPVVAGLMTLAPAAVADGLGLPVPGSAETAPTATVTAQDARLRAGCRDYPLRYQVRDSDEDWLLELVVSDRTGEDVASVTLHGVQSGERGRATFTVCRSAVAAGAFRVDGVLHDRDGWTRTEHEVDGDRFRLTRR